MSRRSIRIWGVACFAWGGLVAASVVPAIADNGIPTPAAQYAVAASDESVDEAGFSETHIAMGEFSDASNLLQDEYSEVFAGLVFDAESATATVYVNGAATSERKAAFQSKVESISTTYPITASVEERGTVSAEDLSALADDIGMHPDRWAAALGTTPLSVVPLIESATLEIGTDDPNLDGESIEAPTLPGALIRFSTSVVTVEFQSR